MEIPETRATPVEPTPPRVRVGSSDLVVFAGLPGAGKSTALDGLRTSGPVLLLDSEQVHRAVRSVLPRRVPYHRYRVVVHGVHRARIAWHCAVTRGPVIAHEPSTRPTTRAMLILIARVTRRPRVLIWLRVDAVEALTGQYERGRWVGARSFARHVRRADRIQHLLRRGSRLRGWGTVRVFTREDLESGLFLEIAQ